MRPMPQQRRYARWEWAMTDCLTIAETAARLTLSQATVRRLVASGQLLAVRLSARRVGIAQGELARYLEDGGWRSGRSTAGGESNFSKLAAAYFADCQRSPPKPTRKRSNRPCAAKSSNVVLLATASRPLRASSRDG